MRWDALFNQDEQVAKTFDVLRAYQRESLPILGIPGNIIHDIVTDDERINDFARFCARTVKQQQCNEVEFMNEPDIMGHITSDQYHYTALAGCRAIKEARPECKIYLAAEILKPNKYGPTPNDYFTQVLKDFPEELWDGGAVHNYRQPGPADVAAIGGWFNNFLGLFPGSREAEHKYCQKMMQGKPYLITETGWDLSRCKQNETYQAANIIKELDYAKKFGIDLVAIYAYVGKAGTPNDFGVFDDIGNDWRPRPVVQAVNDWMGLTVDDDYVLWKEK